MSYPCPFLGTDKETPHCKRPSKNARGLKMHLTAQHGSWTAEQVAAVVAANLDQPTPAEKEEFFSEENSKTLVDTTKNSESQERQRTVTPSVDQGDDSGKRRARKAAVRLSNALGGVKDYISRLLPVFTVQFLKTKMGIEGTLSEEGQKVVGEAWASYFDLLGFDLENAEPVKIKMSGRKLMLIYPLMMIPLTLAVMSDIKRVPVASKDKKVPGPVAVMPSPPPIEGVPSNDPQQ